MLFQIDIYKILKFFLACIAALFFTACSFFSSPSSTTTSSSGVFSPSIPSVSSAPNTSLATHKATMRPYTINGKTYYPTMAKVGDTSKGTASWYGPKFHGKKTSNGETYNMHALTAAHKTLPMNTIVKVVNLKNNNSVIVRINDRGPFVSGRIIDLSKAAANKIGMLATGTAPVRVEVLGFYGQTQSLASVQKSINALNSQNSTTTSSTLTSTQDSAKPTQVEIPQTIQSVSGGEFMVQIGAFRNESGANIYKNEHQEKIAGYHTIVKSYETDDGMLYRVFLSGFRSIEEAQDFVNAKHINGAFIVRE